MGLEALLTGRLLCDRYRVDRVIGRGGMGAVYGGLDTRLDRRVAVKVVTAASAEVDARARLRARFHREARAAARLQHPNVVTVFDFGTDPALDLDFLVMELLDGEDCARRLRHKGPLGLRSGLDVMEQAARGVAAGHRAGLIHRDIKPANLFLVEGGSQSPRVCVLDFGIVQPLDTGGAEATATQLTLMGRAPHSPAYAAPEQLRGDPHLTPAADVWALGATAWELIAGSRPFGERSLRRMMDGATLPAPSLAGRTTDVPDAVDDVFRIALAHRPADRFPDATAFAAALVDARRGLAPGVEHAAAEARADGVRHGGAGARNPTGVGPGPRLDPPGTGTVGAADPTLLDPSLTAAWPPISHPEVHADRRAVTRASGPPTRGAPTAGGWVARGVRAVARGTVTLAVIAVAGLCGVGMFEAFYNDLAEPFYAAVAGLTVSVPWAVHRVLGGHGSFVLALIGCASVAVGLLRFAAPLAGPEAALIALAPLQLVAAGAIARWTHRRGDRRRTAAAAPGPR